MPDLGDHDAPIFVITMRRRAHADLLVKVEAISKRRALRLADAYGNGAIGIADLEQAAQGSTQSKRPTASGKDIQLKLDDQRLVLTARLIFDAITDEQRTRFASAVGVALKRLGIPRVEAAESTTT